METFQIILFFIFLFSLICFAVWHSISLDKQMKLEFKQETEKWEKFKSQIKPGTLLQIEKPNYNPFDDSKYETIKILEVRDGWVKYNFIDKNRELKREVVDKIRDIYEIGFEIINPK